MSAVPRSRRIIADRAEASRRCDDSQVGALVCALVLSGTVTLTLLAGTTLAQTSGTIGSLPAATIDLDTTSAVPDARRRAREHYAALLTAPDVDAALSAEALRRLADLMLEIEEESQSLAGQERLSGDDYERAVVLYQRWLDEHPAHPRSDEVLYQLARAHELGADAELALLALNDLVADWPASPLLAEAHFRRGELLFSERRFADAEHAYVAVLASPGATPFERQARYKLGWSLYRQSEYARAHEAFAGLLQLLPPPGDGTEPAVGSRAEQELIADTLRVMALGFAADGGRESLDLALAGWSLPAWTGPLYQALGELYLEQERHHDAHDAFTALGRTDPMNAMAPALALRGIDSLESGGFADEVLAAHELMYERYAPDQPFWQLHAPDRYPEVMVGLLASVGILARHHHAAAQRTGDAAHRTQAIRWYDRRLTHFPRDGDAAGMHFLMAELLLESGERVAAAEAFEATAYEYPAHARSAEAGYAAVVARRPDVGPDSANAIQVTAYVRGAQRFATTFPAHEHATATLVDAAEMAYAAALFAEALDTSTRALAAGPTVEQARVLWLVAGHTHFETGDDADAEHAYWQAYRLTEAGVTTSGPTEQGLTDETGRRALEQRLAFVIHRQGEAAREAGDYLLAVSHFNRLVEQLPGSAEAPIALFDAAMALIVLDEHQAAARTLQRFRLEHAEHELAERVGENLAFAYEALGRWSEAADEYTRMAATAGDSGEARAARWRAAELHAKAGDRAAEQATLEQIVALHPHPFDEALEARARLLSLATERGDRPTELRWAQELVTFDATGPRTPRSRTLAARASLQLAEPSRERFNAVMLVHPLADSLALKRRYMEEALTAYAAAADYGIAEVLTAATYEIAELYRELAQSLLTSQRPEDLDALAAEQYELLLEEQAFPFEEQAIQIHEANAARAADGIYDQWVSASLARLAELMPARWDKQEMGETLVTRIH